MLRNKEENRKRNAFNKYTRQKKFLMRLQIIIYVFYAKRIILNHNVRNNMNLLRFSYFCLVVCAQLSFVALLVEKKKIPLAKILFLLHVA